MPGQPYVYKASIESVEVDNVSVSETTFGLSSVIIRVSTMENNLTTYSLLVSYVYISLMLLYTIITTYFLA